ncbi:apiosidase-like domain-containing protein [Hyphomicrobium sp. 2TAF46]|uniref:apiosidase-like domain-containing protein n=1 Tax=Hyphomicrobium sp. 2TAF46 TaxID=3233019 RepID=UPI003F93F3E1
MILGIGANSIKISNSIIAFAAISAFLLLAFKIPSRLVHHASQMSLRLSAVGCGEVVADAAFKSLAPAGVDMGFAYPVATSNRRFVDQSGNVYLLKMMSSWAMAQRCSNATITSALEGLNSLGFNAVAVAPFGVHLNESFGDRYRNGSGESFFAGAPYASPFGPAWSSMDWIVQEATRLRMTVVFSLFLSWGDSGTTPDLVSVGPADAYNFGKTLALRYAQYPNIVWHVMGDFVWTASDPVGRQVDAVFHGIKDGEGSSHRLQIGEQQRGWSGHQQFNLSQGGESGYQWFKPSANTLYDYGGNSVELFDAAYGEPGAGNYGVVDIEPPYVNSPHYGGNKDQQYRERNYSVLLRGGIGINFGHEKWWPFGAAGIFDGGAGWFEILNEPPQLQAKYAWSLLDKYVVDPSWSRDDGSFVKLGIGDGDTKAASGYSKLAAVAYFPTGRSVTVDTTVIAGPINVKLSWYDPTTGKYHLISESEAAMADRSIEFPGAHPDGSADWVLVAERT